MADEGNRRMDLNLYLGLPRRPTESSDLGSDLALGSLPLSEEMSSSNTQSYPPVSQPTQPQGEIVRNGSRQDAEYSPYSPSHSPASPTSHPGREAQSLGLEVADDDAPYLPPFVPGLPPTSTEGLVLEGSSSNHDEYVPYNVPYVPASASMSLPRELQEVQQENTHDPYIPVSPTDTRGNNDNDNANAGPVPAITGFRSYHEVEDTSLRDEYLQFPEFRFRRLIEASRRLRVRRYRSRVPYGINTDWSSFSSEAVHAARDTRVSEALAEANSVTQKASTVEDLDQDDDKDKSNYTANFDCNVCLDVAKEPVVTSCGHLFCWPCLFQWLHIHCDHRECPVCKGEVTDSDVTPIYGRGNSEKETKKDDKEADSGLKIPPRPHGRRLESLRQRISRPLSRRPREDMGSWGSIFDEEMNNRAEELDEPPMLGTLEATDRRMLARLMAVQRFRREGSIENLLNFGANGSSSSANEVANSESMLDRLQGLGSIGTHPVLARRGIDFWRRFAYNSILSTDRLAAIASDLSNVVGGMETGASNSGASASTSANPRASRPVSVQRPLQATGASDQASASSTIAVIQGDSGIPRDAPGEPSSVGSSRTLRRRRRNTVSGSLDIDGVNHAFKRRRLN